MSDYYEDPWSAAFEENPAVATQQMIEANLQTREIQVNEIAQRTAEIQLAQLQQQEEAHRLSELSFAVEREITRLRPDFEGKARDEFYRVVGSDPSLREQFQASGKTQGQFLAEKFAEFRYAQSPEAAEAAAWNEIKAAGERSYADRFTGSGN